MERPKQTRREKNNYCALLRELSDPCHKSIRRMSLRCLKIYRACAAGARWTRVSIYQYIYIYNFIRRGIIAFNKLAARANTGASTTNFRVTDTRLIYLVNQLANFIVTLRVAATRCLLRLVYRPGVSTRRPISHLLNRGININDVSMRRQF